MISLDLLQSFVAVAEAEHVGRAAERLHISQSPLSRQIRRLEDQIGMPLFDREKQRIRLTEAGRWLLAEARELLGHARRLEEDAARAVRGDSGRLSIGFVNSALWNRVLPSALRRFHRERPGVELALRTLTSDRQLDAVVRGDLDVGLVQRAAPRADVERVQLFAEDYVLALYARHPLAALEAVSPKDLRGQPWIALSPSLHPSSSRLLARIAERTGAPPELKYETSDRATVLALVESGLGVALLPDSARRVAASGVVFRELPWLGVTTGVDLIHRRSPSELARRFAAVTIASAGQKAAGAASHAR